MLERQTVLFPARSCFIMGRPRFIACIISKLVVMSASSSIETEVDWRILC